jgi:hypothetical protein
MRAVIAVSTYIQAKGLTYGKLKWACESEDSKGFIWQANASYSDETSKMEGLYFKPSKDACMSSNLQALHKYVLNFTGKSTMKLVEK